MSATIPFYKMVASGNDFVIVDNRKRIIKNPHAFTQKVCALHTGIGADGVLLFENSRKADFKMRIINSDGSEAEACGNGFRCIALYAREKMGYPVAFQFESVSGLIQAQVGKNNRVRVQLVHSQADAAELVDAVCRLRPALRSLHRDQQRRRRTRAGGDHDQRQTARQGKQPAETLASHHLLIPSSKYRPSLRARLQRLAAIV